MSYQKHLIRFKLPYRALRYQNRANRRTRPRSLLVGQEKFQTFKKLLNTVDGFPEIENQEWNQACRWQKQKHQEGIFEEYHFPLHWDAPGSYGDPPEEFYIDPPHE